MSLEHLSKNKNQRIKQLSLILHNCRIYGIEPKKEIINEYNKLNKEQL